MVLVSDVNEFFNKNVPNSKEMNYLMFSKVARRALSGLNSHQRSVKKINSNNYKILL